MPARRLHLAQIFARQKQLGGLQEVGLEGGVGSEDAPIASIWSCWLCAVPQLPNGKARGNPSASQQHLHLILQGCREVGHPQISPPPPISHLSIRPRSVPPHHRLVLSPALHRIAPCGSFSMHLHCTEHPQQEGGFKCPPRPILSTGIPPGGKEVPLLAWGIPMAAAFPPCAAAAIPKASQHLQHFGFPAERAFVDSTHTSAGRGKGRNQSSPPHPMLWAEDEAAAQHPRTEPLPALGTAAWRGTAGPPASPRDLGGGCTHNPTSLTGGGCGAAGIIPIPAPIELPSGSRRPNPHPAGCALLL